MTLLSPCHMGSVIQSLRRSQPSGFQSKQAMGVRLPMWQGLSKVIADYLDNITLQDIIDDYQARAVDNYSI